ncbi:hypothetical protein ACVWZR_009283 [Bradyrhizobium sp. i1.3.1]
MSNTTGPPMIATVPEATSAKAQASSKLACSGFHSVRVRHLRVDGECLDLAGEDQPLALRRILLLLVRVSAVHDDRGSIERLLEKALVAFEHQR